MTLKSKIPHLIFFGFFLANLFLWSHSHKIQARWLNVPPVPDNHKATLFTLGDSQLAYRVYALLLQNIGNVGGRAVSLRKYDYDRLNDWFLLEDGLDSRADIVPMLAANYFGAVDQPEKLNKILNYLALVGGRPEKEKWRWLAQAVFLARHVMKDNDRALELAYLLSNNQNPNLADWAKQMPAFILQEEGQSELAYKIMLNILISNIDTLHPNEINYMQDYICNTLLPELPDTPRPNFCL